MWKKEQIIHLLFLYHITTKNSQSQLCSASNPAHNADSYVVQAANTGTRRSGYDSLAPRFIPSSPRLFPLRERAWVRGYVQNLLALLITRYVYYQLQCWCYHGNGGEFRQYWRPSFIETAEHIADIHRVFCFTEGWGYHVTKHEVRGGQSANHLPMHVETNVSQCIDSR